MGWKEDWLAMPGWVSETITEPLVFEYMNNETELERIKLELKDLYKLTEPSFINIAFTLGVHIGRISMKQGKQDIFVYTYAQDFLKEIEDEINSRHD